MVQNPPSKADLKQLWQASGLPLKAFFNTSGQQYRALGLKDRLAQMSEEEQLALLASNGMLIKRPIATDADRVSVGFKTEQFESVWRSA